jgi:predicted RNA-binding protein with PUA-like domain
VDIVAVRALKTPVSLEAIKADPQLSHIPLLRQSRLSVMPLEKEAFERILAIGQSKENTPS